MIKTIELILGLPTMTLFDLIANDMRRGCEQLALWRAAPDFRAFRSLGIYFAIVALAL